MHAMHCECAWGFARVRRLPCASTGSGRDWPKGTTAQATQPIAGAPSGVAVELHYACTARVRNRSLVDVPLMKNPPPAGSAIIFSGLSERKSSMALVAPGQVVNR